MYENKMLNSDPRTPLDLASRDELFAYAKANGVTEIDDAMYMGAYASIKMKKILISKGLTNPQTRLRRFTEDGPPAQEAPAVDADALADLPQEPLGPRVTVSDMKRAELAKECKARGIKMARTDTKEQLLERLNGQQNAA